MNIKSQGGGRSCTTTVTDRYLKRRSLETSPSCSVANRLRLAGESFYISVYNAGLKASNKLTVSHWEQGDEFFASKKISITGYNAAENDPDQDFENLAINLYPNPGSGQLLVSLCSPETQNISITVHNLNGQCVYEQNDLRIEKGIQELGFDLSFLNAGIYSLKVESARETIQYKFVVVK